MKKFAISKFDIGFIIAFVVVALLGGGAWWYLSGELQSAQGDVTTADQTFNRYSKDTKYDVVVNAGNIKLIQANLDAIKSQVDPIIPDKLQSKDNKLKSIDKEDPVAWKHDLDDLVKRLTDLAKTKVVTLPKNFYFGFSRYLSQNPGDEQTAVLSKQLVGVEQIADLVINAPVQGITSIRRSYDEDVKPGSTPNQGGFVQTTGDDLGIFAVTPPSGLYTAYPFEITFDTSSESLRSVIDGLLQSPYVFIVRSMVIKNTKPLSPKTTDLDNIVNSNGNGGASVTGSAPGEVAATTSTLGPQSLFGDSHLTVILRVDMIEWKGLPQ
jgi:hypothetical protein